MNQVSGIYAGDVAVAHGILGNDDIPAPLGALASGRRDADMSLWENKKSSLIIRSHSIRDSLSRTARSARTARMERRER